MLGCSNPLPGRNDTGGFDAGNRDASADARPDSDPMDVGPIDSASDAPDAPIDCDTAFRFDPAASGTGEVNQVSYRHIEGLTHIGLTVSAPSEVGRVAISGEGGLNIWTFPVAFHEAGIYDVAFTAEMGGRVLGTCRVSVADTGPPPDLEDPPDCTGRVCGESDGAGGTCSRCPMVESEGGACMDPPSPIGPGGPGPWSCLDSAGCTGGGCVIWCPGEPCDTERHPDGCPQGVESCFVEPGITDYEEACRTCCRARHHAPTGEFACWDDAINVCRYPGDCGMPFPLP